MLSVSRFRDTFLRHPWGHRLTLTSVSVSLAFSVLLALTPQAHAAPTVKPSPDEAAFLHENDVAMDRMMRDMTVKPGGDIDHDFVAMMIPHHQGAIDMAQAELRYGKNEQLRRIAQEIIVEQQQEIIAMRIALGQPLPPSAPAPTGAVPPAQGSAQDTPPPAGAMSAMHHHHGE
ncbi:MULTISPECIES: DUF305 domain-containing protein [Pandoraea]|uniref:DUF305 domain-containing protein n=1 Tax=Pandoraea capi TaxID=2508286 RepID=A0ABY6VQW6_9BURK|nr:MULTISPECIES: DUF305 domain-containing protein [Pandoraea]MCI3208022.1 DUF305 domain-containing protein [Pandoraea sp. LA3]MDN4586051.1 DUF305 domain-containing protein [Pandoraea capi]VVD77402.1 hypothetical protein PCA20602_00930 [Pandoraea capi]